MTPVFIGGCGRSGTTLLGSILGSHSDCVVTPESKFVYLAYREACRRREEGFLDVALQSIVNHPNFKMWDLLVEPGLYRREFGDYAELILELVDCYGRKVGNGSPRYWVDHTPMNTDYASTMKTLFRDARLIHIVRDGRAVAASILDLDWGPNTALGAAEWWRDHVAVGIAGEQFFGSDRSMEVRFEDLVREPHATIASVCQFLEIDFQSDMLEGRGLQLPAYTVPQHALVGQRPVQSRASAWMEKLTARQVEIIEDVAGDMLAGLGYALRFGAAARAVTRVERVNLRARDLVKRRLNRARHRRRTDRYARSGTLGD